MLGPSRGGVCQHRGGAGEQAGPSARAGRAGGHGAARLQLAGDGALARRDRGAHPRRSIHREPLHPARLQRRPRPSTAMQQGGDRRPVSPRAAATVAGDDQAAAKVADCLSVGGLPTARHRVPAGRAPGTARPQSLRDDRGVVGQGRRQRHARAARQGLRQVSRCLRARRSRCGAVAAERGGGDRRRSEGSDRQQPPQHLRASAGANPGQHTSATPQLSAVRSSTTCWPIPSCCLSISRCTGRSASSTCQTAIKPTTASARTPRQC